jgi:hypothetical protein
VISNAADLLRHPQPQLAIQDKMRLRRFVMSGDNKLGQRRKS